MSAKAMACPYGVVCVYLRRGLPNVVLRDKNQRKSTSSSYLDYMKSMVTSETKKLREARDARMMATEEMGQAAEHEPNQNTNVYKFYGMKTDDKRENLLQGVVAQEYFFWLNL